MQGLVLLLYVAGQNLGVVLPSVIATSGYGLADDDPRIVVAEDAGILLVALSDKRKSHPSLHDRWYRLGC